SWPLAVSPMFDAFDAIACNESRALQQYAGDLGPILDGAALVVDRLAGGRACRRSGIERLLVELRAGERLGRVLDQQHGRRDGAKTPAPAHAGSALPAQAHADPP